MRRKRFVLLDRDGTVVVDRGHLSDPDELELIEGAGPALARLQELGLGLLLVSNQSVIGRGLLDAPGLELVHERLARLLAEHDVSLDGIYFCPHLPEEGCACRKPATALVERAAAQHHFDPAESFVVGDKGSDIELGRRVGATTILVRTGYGQAAAADPAVLPDHIAADLGQAARVIASLLDARAATATGEGKGGG